MNWRKTLGWPVLIIGFILTGFVLVSPFFGEKFEPRGLFSIMLISVGYAWIRGDVAK